MSKPVHSSALALCQKAMAILRQENRLTVISPDAPTKVERACYDAYESSRLEVVSSFGWSFLKADKRVYSATTDEEGRYCIPYPQECLKVLNCYDEDGHKIPFTVRGNDKIYSLVEIRRITYIFDEENVDTYPPLVYDAIVKTLAKNLTIEVTGRPADYQLNDALAKAAVQTARTDDARHGSTGSEVYGKNHIYECMCGRRNPFKRRGL